MVREQRAKAHGQKNLDDFKLNDLDYEAGPQEMFLYEGISFNLATELGERGGFGLLAQQKRLLRSTQFWGGSGVPLCGSTWAAATHHTGEVWGGKGRPGDACPCPGAAAEPCGVPSARSECLDEALALWKQLLASEGVPAVRSPEQTVASLHIMASLYRLMAKVALLGLPGGSGLPPALSLDAPVGFSPPQPLQAIESYLLVRALCDALGDSLGMASALCQVTKLLLQLECHSYAEARPVGEQRGGRAARLLPTAPALMPACLASSSSWRRQSPACRKLTSAAIPTCCCSKPA